MPIKDDGRTSPEEYVRFRAQIGMTVVALSDHDSFAGVARAAATAAAVGVTLVPAMEATSFIHFGTPQAEQVHVLAYFPPAFLDDHRLERTFLAARAARVHERWKGFVLEWLDGLPRHERGPLDPTGELALRAAVDFPGLQTMINLIDERNRAVFDSFHRHHVRFWDHPELFGWQPEELIEAIRADGALDVVAHGNRVRDKARMDRVLHHAQGVEVYTSRHSAQVAARFLAFAVAEGKHWTASSDDHQHGAYIRPPSGTPRRTVERILAGYDVEGVAQPDRAAGARG